MKRMSKTLRVLIPSILAMLAAFAIFLGVSGENEHECVERDLSASMLADTSERLEIIKNGKTDFVIHFAASDSISIDSVKAKELSDLIKTYGVYLSSIPDGASEPQDYEILIGTTNRAESLSFYEELLSAPKNADDLVWGYCVVGTKILFTANRTEAFDYGFKSFISYLEGCSFAPAVGVKSITVMTVAEYEAILEAEKQEQLNKRLEELIAMNEKFKDEPLLNGWKLVVNPETGAQLDKVYEPYKKMIGTEEEVAAGKAYFSKNPYDDPWVYPTEGEHPRFLLNSTNVKRIQELVNDPEYKNLFDNLYVLAEYDYNYGVFVDRDADGTPHDYMKPTDETYRYDEMIISAITARAMMYLITGEEIYAYEAIIGIKNAIVTLKFTQDIHVDIYHGASHLIVALSAVYDWCYDVMTDEDRWQIINGTVGALWPTMEFTYPPSNMSAVGGHGTGPQFLRDYVSLAIAFYDECPDWYDFIFGRYFEQYLPAANVKFESGLIPGGTTTYAPIKIYVQLWSAYLLKVATGEHFITEDVNLGVKFMLEHIMPNGNYFQTGDGDRRANGQSVSYAEFFTLAGLTGDPLAYAWAKYLSGNYSWYMTDYIFTMTPDFQLCFLTAANITEKEEVDKYEALPLAEYFDFPVGYIMARNSWESDAAAVMMKLQNKNTQDHDVYDHGTFQIYYKGLLAGSSGSYKKFGSAAHYQYLHSTIAHNGILVFNPSKIAPVSTNASGDILNQESCYYSGSQVLLEAPATIEDWNENYEIVDTLGHQIGYFPDGTPRYAYLAGDLTNAYEQDTVDHVLRSMFTLYTGDEEVPMIFFTFDQIASDKEYYEKTFLLHTVNEPTVDAENMTAEIVNGGKLVVKSLYGADKMEKVGGEGKYFWINDYYDEAGVWHEGREIWDKYLSKDYGKEYWGRVQLRASGEKQTSMLTAMFVTDKDSTADVSFTTFINNDVYGSTFNNNKVVFLSGRDKLFNEFTFNSGEEKGLFNYYFFGVEDGTWNIRVDGVSVGYSFSTDGEGMLSFVAPAGEVTLVPGKDVLGANGGKIVYSSGGALLPGNTPYTYKNDETVVLPTTAVRGDDKFLGWYLTDECLPEDRVYEVPEGQTGTFRVYAKWLITYTNEDYSSTNMDLVNISQTINGIYYVANKTQARISTKTDKNGVRYLEWLEGTRDPFIQKTSSTKNIATSTADDKTISYTVSMSANEGYTNMQSDFVIRTKKTVDGVGINGGVETVLFSTKTNGDVMLGSKNKIGQLYTGDVITTVRIAVDFKNGKIKAYDEAGELIDTINYEIPKATGAKTTEELMKCYDEILFDWRARTSDSVSTAAIRVYSIKMEEGNAFEELKDSFDKNIIYATNGGLLSNKVPTKFSKSEVTALPDGKDVTRYGYDFNGWYTTPTFDEGTLVTEVPIGIKDNYFRVYAKWTLRTDTLYYDLKGGTFEGTTPLPPFYDKVNGTELAPYVPTRYGYVFDGWYDDSHYSGEPITLLGKGATEPIYLYAKWKIDPTTLYVELDGGTVSVVLPDFYDKENGTPLPIPTKPNCTFDGWYTTYDFKPESKLGDTVGKGAEEPITIYAKWLVPDNAILYDVRDGNLPDDAPTSYTPGTAVTLPTNVTKSGYIFGGWYTNSMCEGDSIKVVPADATGGYYLYAKWLKIIVTEDYSETTVNSVDKNQNEGPLAYNTLNAETPIVTVDDESGNTYLRVNRDPDGSGNKIIYYSNSKYNLTHFTETAISYEIDIWKLSGKSLSSFSVYIPTASSKFGSLSVLTVKGATGEVVLDGTDVCATTVTEARQTLRITIDFAKGTVSIFDEYGNVLGMSTLKVPEITKTAKEEGYSQPTTLLEWQKIAQNHLLFMSASGADSAVAIDNIRIIEGKFFEKDRTSDSIVYNTAGGKMPASYPTHYVSGGTAIDGVIPERFGFVFDGWYDNAAYEGEKITSVGVGKSTSQHVYAKWITDSTVIHFNPMGGANAEGYPTNYNPETGIVIGDYNAETGVYTTDYVPTKYGYVFAGWYDNETLTGNPVTVIGQGATEQITLFAKWEIDPRTIYVDLDGGVLENTLPDFYDPENGTDISGYIPTRENYSFVGWYDNPELSGDPVTVIGKGSTAPITLYAKWAVADGTIIYEAGGGTLPNGVPTTYNPETATPLPTDVTRKGYVFAGWYTSSKFDGERITEIPAGATGGYALYARWLKIFINEDYDTTGTVVNIADKNSNTFGGLIYNATQVGVSIKTTGKNDKYLVVTSTKSPAQVALSEGKYNLRTMTDTAVSYQISLRAADGQKLSKFQIYIPTRSSKLGALYVGNSGTDGSFKLTNSDVELAKITADEWITLRITLDFAAGTVTAYDEHGNILDRSEPNVPTISDAALGAGMKQPTTLAEWQRLDGAVASDMPYLVYFYSEGDGTIYYDDIKIIEGEFFDLDRANNSIIYHTGGGALANGISTYDPVSGTDVSAVKPTKYGYIFDGWYTEDDVKVDGNVGIGQTAPVTLYAKWSVDNTVIIFNPDGGKMPTEYPTNYDSENGTDVSGVVPTKDGYNFVCWLDSEGNPVTVIGQGKTEQIALTAKWEIRPDTLYFELGGGTLATQLPKYYDANIGTIVNSADYMPTRYGYVFAGWYTDSEFTERVTEEYVPAFDKPITLYAKWDIRPDTLYAELNGGTLEAPLPDFYQASLGEMLKDYVPTKPNSEFGGWYTDPSFAEKYRVTESLVVDFTAPITIYARWLLPNGSIFYETNGGAFTAQAPESYNTAEDTILTTDIVRNGYVFAGWYTDARFTSERVTYIPKGALGGYQLYAKWLKVYTDEDYDTTETEVDVVGKKDMYLGNITYNATAVGVSIKTEAEGDNKYLLVTSTVASSAQVVRSGSFKTMTETAISYQISIKAVEGENLRKFSLWIPTKSSKYGTLSVATSDVSGSFKLANSTKEIAKFTSTEWTTVRVVLDFASGEAIAYDEFGNVLDRSKLTVPTLTAAALSEGIKQPTTLAEWQRLEGVDAAQFPYLIYFNSEGIGQIAFDNLKVIEGNVFDNATNAIAPHNSIKYEIGEGGKLPEGYSTIYDAVNGTNLPIPTRDCYEFLGWYLDEDCEGTSVTKVGAGQTGDRAITVYAKWRFITNTIAYNTNGGTMPDEYTVIYDKENGYDVSGVVPTLKGYRFGGWYESETFEGTRANVVGVGTDAPIALYARWYKVLAEENFERDNPEDEINVPAGENNLYGAFEYNTKNKGCSFATVTDTVTGNKYLEVTADGTATVYKSSSYNLKTMIDTAISYDITLWAIEGKAVSKFSLYLPTSGSKCGTLSIVSQDSNGNIKFNGTGEDILIGNINDGALVLHITVDFADGYAYAFDEAGDVIAKSLLIVPTITQAAIDEGLAEGQPETLGEWQRIATNHLGHITATGLGYLAFDNVCILEGRAFSK